MRRRRPPHINQTIIQTSELSMKIPEVSKIETRKTNQAHSSAPAQSITNSNDEVTHRNPIIKDPTYIPPPKPVRTPMQGSSQCSESTNINAVINIALEENSPFQEGIISEIYQRSDNSFFQEP